MSIVHVKGNTFCIDTGMSLIPYYQINDEEIILLDSGWANGERDLIDGILIENGLKVSGIINSHAHVDHIGNNQYLKNKSGCIIAMSSHEAMLCNSAVNLKTYYGNINLTMVEQHCKEMICETDIMIDEAKNSIYMCGIKFEIIHTPGHSPAHICIVTPDKVAYVGDCLITDEVMNGAKMPYAFILREDIRSKESLYDLNYSKYIVAHRGIFDDIKELVSKNINFYKSRAVAVKNEIKGKMTLEEIMKATVDSFNIKIKPDNIFRFLVIERMVKSYIDYLVETDVAGILIEDGFAKFYIK